ncbi:MAG: hypothetical protein WCH57_07630 [Verrucomicrobiota bacterium]
MMSAPRLSDTLYWTKGWLLLSAYLTCSGWVLSALGHLDALGYGVALLCGLAALLLAASVSKSPLAQIPPLRLHPRFRRFLPAFFLLLCGLAFLGGALYSPNNYDALTYRFPRILHWVAEGRWHWISTTEMRMNLSGTGMEWLMTPLFVFTRSDRFFFLFNLASFALLPGLTYGTFTRLGIPKRQAWYWMWLLPAGYCYASQAGSIGNDSFTVVYLLAALCLTLRFRETRRPGDFWMGMLAAALLTGAKTSNLPLLAPWVLAALPSLRFLKGKLPQTAAVAGICVVVSFVPLAWENWRNTGDWAGDPTNKGLMKISNPVYGVLGNGLQILSQNVEPPVMPCPQIWNGMAERFLQSPRGRVLVGNFPRISLKWVEFQNEEASGLGVGLCGLLVATGMASLLRRNREARPAGATLPGRGAGMLVCLGGWVALAAYMAKMGSESAPRLIAPYYPLLVATVLLLPGVALVVRRRWWKALAVLAALSALPSMVLTPSRPLWPALSVCQRIAGAHPGNPLAARALSVYSIYRNRNDGLAPLRKYLSPEDKAVGFIGADSSEVALWRPFGQRRVVDVTPFNQAEIFHANSLVCASAEAIQIRYHQSVESWLGETRGRLVAREALAIKAARGTEEWCVIRFGSGHP